MRLDLNKLLCERERHGHRSRFKPHRHTKAFTPCADEDGDNRPQREGMAYRYGHASKRFNENLNPLKGQIRKAAGRKWDAFYSELCSVFDMRSVINAHVLQHLRDFIERDVLVKDDGKLYARNSYGAEDIPLGKSRAEFYVDPRTGIIRANKQRLTYRQGQRQRAAARAAEEAKVLRRLADDTVLRKIDDTWFLFDVREIPNEPVYDSFLRTMVARSARGANTYHSNRRTASRKVLRRAGL